MTLILIENVSHLSATEYAQNLRKNKLTIGFQLGPSEVPGKIPDMTRAPGTGKNAGFPVVIKSFTEIIHRDTTIASETRTKNRQITRNCT